MKSALIYRSICRDIKAGLFGGEEKFGDDALNFDWRTLESLWLKGNLVVGNGSFKSMVKFMLMVGMVN